MQYIRLPVIIIKLKLVLHHVQAGRADLPGLDPGDQRLGIDQASPRRIDDHHAVFHSGDRVRPYHVAVFIRKRRMQGNDIRPPPYFFQCNIFRVLFHPLIFHQVICNHFASKTG